MSDYVDLAKLKKLKERFKAEPEIPVPSPEQPNETEASPIGFLAGLAGAGKSEQEEQTTKKSEGYVDLTQNTVTSNFIETVSKINSKLERIDKRLSRIEKRMRLF